MEMTKFRKKQIHANSYFHKIHQSELSFRNIDFLNYAAILEKKIK